jgi:hypothetical protein
VTDERDATEATEAPTGPALATAAPAAPPAIPGRAPRAAVTPGGVQGRRRHPAGGSPEDAARAPRRRRTGMRLEGRTTTSYPLRDDARRTVGYLRLVVGQAHIPDEANVAVDVDRITIEWDD